MLLSRLAWTFFILWHTRGQARYPFRKPEIIARDQARRVRSIVRYAWRHVPYYRETIRKLGITPDDFRSADDLAKLPVLHREQIQRDPEFFKSEVGNRDSWLTLRSEGSTGRPIRVSHSKAEILYLAAISGRFRAIVHKTIGRKFGYRETHILTRESSNSKIRNYWAQNALLLDGIPARLQRLALTDSPETNLRLINAFKPDALYSYGSYLGLLFETVHAKKLTIRKPKLVAYGADQLPFSSRQLIHETFGIPTFSMYHSIEFSRLAFECERHTGLHVNADMFPVRITDAEGRTLPEGAEGEVVASNLLNTATVLLNYRLGDLATALPPCPCGRSLPLISYPQGRCADWIRLPSGAFFHVANLFAEYNYSGVWQWQLIQETPLRYVLKLVIDPATDRALVLRLFRQILVQVFGPKAETEIRIVDSIERMPSGKHRVFISLMNKEVQTYGQTRLHSI
ncbi:MAG: phenylacetate--CoA ligase family protein [Kiritimatiellia bacterium]